MKQKHIFYRRMALTMVWVLIYQICFPVMALALTGGPSQPEVSGFEPVGSSNMVDLFTGDFMYNIPLLDVDGYPINMSYHADPGMDAESSWVGLGFSLNPGVLNRQMRGFPDDFKEEHITKQFNLKEDRTVGISQGAGIEISGFFGISWTRGIFHNTYRGFGLEEGISSSISQGDPAKGLLTTNLGLNFNSQQGLDVSIGYTTKDAENKFKMSFGTGFNSRRGLKDLTISGGIYGKQEKDKNPKTRPGGATFSFGHTTYFPTSLLPLKNNSFSFHGTVGGEFVTVNPHGVTNGYVTQQYLATKQSTQRAYGSLYSTEGKKSAHSLLDFNWDGERVYREDIPTIPMAFGTYDLLTATGQGVGGQFRVARNDVGVFHNARHNNQSVSLNGGFELGFGNAFHAGADINVGVTNTTSTLWKKDNQALDNLDFTEVGSSSNKLYEPAYFKSSGERTISDPSFFTETGEDAPVRVQLNKTGATVVANKVFEKQRNLQPEGAVAMTETVSKEEREKRNQVFSYLTAKEAALIGLDKTINNYKKNTLIYPSCNSTDVDKIERSNYPDHHISETTITQANGSRYVYGLPAYNNKYKEVTFSVAAPTSPNADLSLVDYNPNNPNADNSFNNKKGREHYFDSKDIPPYAHSWLLTGVLSADYVDVTNDGITDDDLGTAVKINYTRTEENYRWRVPVQENKARHEEGYLSDSEDDKATYLYGEKELWYVHSIESRTMVAQFYTSDRKDAWGVQGENGGFNFTSSEPFSRPSQKLDSIALFSKSELAANPSNPLPIKTVHFDYTYSSCKGLLNYTGGGEGGKLTLDKVYFTYQHSQRGLLNAYQFQYNNINPNYNIGHYDRWGGYKENPTGFPSNLYYPYTLQDESTINSQIGAWNLTDIILPSGGKIKVTYEPDDYAYVQNKRAGQMHFIKGFASTPNGSLSNNLYDANLNLNKYMVMDVPIDANNPEKIKRRYFEGVDKLYFHCFVDLDGTGNEDYITGYMKYDKNNITTNNNNQLVIPIEPIMSGNQEVHPISKATFQTMRLDLPQLVYPGYEADQVGESLIQSLIGLGNEIGNVIRGFDKNSMRKNWGKTVDTNQKSWLRLCNPNYKKYASSTRVKKIELTDEWNAFTNPENIPDSGEATSTYGQEYDYTTDLPFFEGNLSISSGVAAYEPIMGNEENLMREPLPYADEILLAPDNYYYTEKPIGEPLFPAPTIGYSKVTVKNLSHADVTRTATGKTVSEFYTAKDFPVITDYTSKDVKKVKANPILKFFKFKASEHLTVTQGYKVEVNDMHGKPKVESIFNELGAMISSTEYKYKTDNPDDEILHLNNEVQVVQPDGSIRSEQIGVDIDIWQGMQEEENKTQGMGVAFNSDGFFIFIIPALVPSAIPIYQEESTRFRSSVTTKFIKRFGILDEVIVTENGSTLTTENVLFDSETGDVLLTRTQNEFNDDMFQFTYPAHWAYDGMGQAYKNVGAVFENVDYPLNPNHFIPGDEVFIEKKIGGVYQPEPGKYTVNNFNGNLIILKPDGTTYGLPQVEKYRVKIIRSGRRNQAGFSIGSIASRFVPVNNSNTQLEIQENKKILQASVLEFSDEWHTKCQQNISTIPGSIGIPFLSPTASNLYSTGIKGNWRPDASYIFYADRSPDMTASITDIQTDGHITLFNPFWTYNNSYWIPPTTLDKWTLSNDMTMYDIRGNQIENQDAIGNYSAVYFGYNNNKAVAVASNSQQKEMTFDGLEDYDFNNNCTDNAANIDKNFTLYDASQLDAKYQLNDQISHSGLYSLLLGTNKSVTIPFVNQINPCSDGVGSFSSFTIQNCDPVINAGTSCCACLPKLQLTAGEDYVISTWIATDNSLGCGAAPLGVSMELAFHDQNNNLITPALPPFLPTGGVIEGWQRLESSFTVPTNTVFIYLTLDNSSTTDNGYFDDFRIHHFFSNQRSFVYDPQSMRLMAELDENNYASFYEYDDEGTLIRVKRETEKGIVTVQEARTTLKPNVVE